MFGNDPIKFWQFGQMSRKRLKISQRNRKTFPYKYLVVSHHNLPKSKVW